MYFMYSSVGSLQVMSSPEETCPVVLPTGALWEETREVAAESL
jgi:hypothetical protein